MKRTLLVTLSVILIVSLFAGCSGAKTEKKESDGKVLSQDMEKILRERRSYIANAAEGGDILPLTNGEDEGITAQVIVPIVSGGDCLGAVAVLSKEEGAKMDGSDMNLAKLTADILANQFD